MKKQGEKKEAFHHNLKPILLTTMVEVRIAGEIRDVTSPGGDLNLTLNYFVITVAS